ncbi:GNAT family N-acetyltransferase [Nocardia sp. NBC_00508]|uniref:GNAT family N-acetyltransferase n=1 Tax=Nocardia sp. NBC_00508 TaxID=2975992 RepID=UPI002E8040E5|nr:GNAT family N-acetyltransferase [Nocardia sp. NBC_00508]WUD67527.1 GNAT family N-acetyltransferase [Nocardia sp. NBC_00508]
MEIRGFADGDRSALRDLFVRAGAESPTESLWGHPESEAAVYLEPYMDLEPESLFVAESDGALVGYLTGCVDSSAFPSEGERMDQAIRRYRLMFRRESAAFFARSLADMAGAAIRRAPTAGEIHDDRWPSHLHINVAPEARGIGAADRLMLRWFERLTEAGSPGCHLQTLVENSRAVRFFDRMGFTAHGREPLVPGLRYHGKRVHQRTMVRDS